MKAQTLLFFVHIPTVLVRILFEASYPVMVILVTVRFGQTINVLEAVQCITEARISLQKTSTKHTVVAIFKAAITLVFGVSGILVMPQWWWLEEEVVGVAGQITESGSRKMKKEHLYNSIWVWFWRWCRTSPHFLLLTECLDSLNRRPSLVVM